MVTEENKNQQEHKSWNKKYEKIRKNKLFKPKEKNYSKRSGAFRHHHKAPRVRGGQSGERKRDRGDVIRAAK